MIVNQKNRPVGLILSGGSTTIAPLLLYPNPQAITYTRPTRATIVQTLGGAWSDDFGEGVIEVDITGNTGWSNGVGGEVRIHLIQDLIITQFHALRAEAAANGDDPDSIKLTILDTLNIFAAVVYPVEVEISKSVDHPLLWTYRIKLLVLDKLFDGGDVLTAVLGLLE